MQTTQTTDRPETQALERQERAAEIWRLMSELQGHVSALNISPIGPEHPRITLDIVERLWRFGREHADDRGFLPDTPTIDVEIARACNWYRDPSLLIESLLQSGLLDYSEPELVNRLNGWPEVLEAKFS